MKHYRTIRYRLHPNTQAKTESLFALTGACRHVWNHFVGKLKDDYEFYGQCDYHWYSTGRLFMVLRHGRKDWLQAYSANIVKHTLKPIEVAYKQLFQRSGGLMVVTLTARHLPVLRKLSSSTTKPCTFRRLVRSGYRE